MSVDEITNYPIIAIVLGTRLNIPQMIFVPKEALDIKTIASTSIVINR